MGRRLILPCAADQAAGTREAKLLRMGECMERSVYVRASRDRKPRRHNYTRDVPRQVTPLIFHLIFHLISLTKKIE